MYEAGKPLTKIKKLAKNVGCLPFSQKNPEISVESQMEITENPFRNCRFPPEVVLFFHMEQNAKISLPFATFSNFSLLSAKISNNRKSNSILSAILLGWIADFGKTLDIIQSSSRPVYSDKW